MNDSTHGRDETAQGPDWQWRALSPVETAPETAADDDAEWLGWVDATEDTPTTGYDYDAAAEDGGEELELPADPMAQIKATMRARADEQARRRTLLTRAGIGAGALVVLLAVIGTVAVALGGHDSGAAASPGPSPAVPPQPVSSSAKPVWCREIDTPTRVVSSGPGDESTAIGVIVAQQYGFYVLRDVGAVRAHEAPDAVVASPEATAAAIAALPGGTAHCVTVTARSENQFAVTVVERHPDGTEVPWDQLVSTAVRDGRVVITSIKAGS